MSKAINISADEFQLQVVESELPVVVDFYANWCAPCRQVSPVIDALSDEYADRVRFVKINVEENMELAGRYSVNSLPTLVTVKNGEEIERMTGMVNRGQLVEKVDQLLQ